ncbi:hypothetical protein PC121_g23356 [Phytophthora cactorum]|nr:hypothetical protein PC120_g25418 [Phytophthora cactorum]KAG3041469.1 hypothetical protein PC121_g23356 [Phytophthora cactorum]KAG4038613.1 hypothetical protein PC123_g25827 [Phytophthora cactorum]
MLDVRSKRCSEDVCIKQPTFALPGEIASCCKEHATEGMLDAKNKRCSKDGCAKQPHFALLGEKASRCKEHAADGMLDVTNKRCETCQMTTMNPKYKPNCAQCHFYLNPNDPRVRNYKTKEAAIMSVVEASHPEMLLDMRVSGGCSRRRPDGYMDLLTHVTIVEVDENEHRSYADSCSNRRMMELYGDFGNRPLVFVRINPDAYKLNGKRVKGAFSTSKSDGQLKVNAKELARRCADVLDMVDHHMKTTPDRAITVEYLYFSD